MTILLALLTLNLAAPLVLFIGFYVTGSSWKSTPVGRFLLLQKLSVLAILTIVLIDLATFGAGSLTAAIIKAIVLLVAGVAFWGIFWALLQAQKISKNTTLPLKQRKQK